MTTSDSSHQVPAESILPPFETQVARQSATHLTLVPTIAVDPGGRTTAISVIVGGGGTAHCPDYAIVRSTAQAVRVDHTRDADDPLASEPPPDPLYEARVLQEINRLQAKYDADARRWWAGHGHIVPATETPWLVAVEKTNPPQEKPSPRCPGYPTVGNDPDGPAHRACWHITPDVAGPMLACSAVETAVRTWWGPERTVRVRPHQADDRWRKERGGTGRMSDHYPAEICDTGDRQMSHVRAAWSIGADAASDYALAVTKRAGVLLPPYVGLQRLPYDGLLRIAPDERLYVSPAPGRHQLDSSPADTSNATAA